MGRCNGGGGARHGGGGYQDGQAKGTKAGKRGHGKSGQHDATASTREVQKRDKFGKPLSARSYLVVTVPMYQRFDQPEVSQ